MVQLMSPAAWLRRRRERRDAQVLAVLADGPLWGLEVARRAGMPSGTAHPTLARLEGAGLVESGWGYPRRRIYWLTDTGRQAAVRAL